MRRRLMASLCFMAVIQMGHAQDPTVGLLYRDGRTAGGYTLFAPLSSTRVYLIDIEGRLVHGWNSQSAPGNSVCLEADGRLLHTGNPGANASRINAGGAGGLVEELDWNSNLIWSYSYVSESVRAHHDVERLPNGNLLMIAWEYKSKAEAVSAGRNPARINQDALWPDHIIEVDRDKNIVWEWHVWDHLIQDFDAAKSNYGIPADHPERIDLNFIQNAGPDLCHLNAIDYQAGLDQILVSSRTYSEIWIIDHSTSTAEAAGSSGGNSGRGGDILYRWGNPAAYDAGSAADQQLFGQHDAHWIPESLDGGGHILMFNNGDSRPGTPYSTIIEIEPPADGAFGYSRSEGEGYGPVFVSWKYEADPSDAFFGSHISGAQRLAGGNTLICEGPTGRFFEVLSSGETVWTYVNPVTQAGILSQGASTENTRNEVFRCLRYTADFPAFAGHDMTAGDFIEHYSTEAILSENTDHGFYLEQNYPNPFNGGTKIEFTLDRSTEVEIIIYDVTGKRIRNLDKGLKTAGHHEVGWDSMDDSGALAASGLYLLHIQVGEMNRTVRMLLLR